MKVRRVVIRKSDIEDFPEDEKLLMATAMLALNEVNILASCVVATAPSVHPPRNTRESAKYALLLFFNQLLAGKLLETWNVLRGDRALASRREDLSDRARAGRVHLAEYFDGTSGSIRLLRKKPAFHFDREAISTAIKSFAPDEPFEIWLPSTHAGEARFELGAKITAAFLNTEIEPREGIVGYDQFMLETKQAWQWMSDLLYGILDVLLPDALVRDVRDEELPDEPEPILPVLGRALPSGAPRSAPPAA